jgi:DNA-binding transcriptional ArsR family regulator
MGVLKTKRTKVSGKVAPLGGRRLEPKPLPEKATSKTSRLTNAAAKASAVLQTVSDPIRLQVFLTLSDRERSVEDLRVNFGQSQSSMNHHLALLRHGGLVDARRQGKQNLYSLTGQGHQFAHLLREIMPQKRRRKVPAAALTPIDPALLEDVRAFVDDPERWFRTPNAAFEGRKPIDLLGTADESRLRNRIEAAKLGMFS